MAGETLVLKMAPRMLAMAEQRIAGKVIAEAAEKGLLTLAKTEGTLLTKSALATGDVLNLAKTETGIVAKTLSSSKTVSFGKIESTVVKTAQNSGKDLVSLHPRYAKGGFPSDYVPKARKFVEVRAKVTGFSGTYQGKNGTWHQDVKIEVQEVLKPLQGVVTPNAAAKYSKLNGVVGGQMVEGVAKGKLGSVTGTIEPGMKLKVSHNISIGSKVPLQKGDEIIVRGMPFNNGGGPIKGLHWTHHAMRPNDAGFIKLIRTGTRFQ